MINAQLIKSKTPIEEYNIGAISVSVKREDLCVPKEGPPFSKVRGLFKKLQELKKQGIETVGYTETSISMAGWGVSWLCAYLNMDAVIFNPIYKETPLTLERHREQWKRWGATIIDIKAGMARVNYNISKRLLKDEFSGAYMLPLGLTLNETVYETATEFCSTKEIDKFKTIVVNVGSGTICSGILLGAFMLGTQLEVYGVMGRTGDITRKRNKINPSFGQSLGLIDPGYQYTDFVDVTTPFPCNKYYDKKAWLWLMEHYNELNKPILFWNIGADTP